MATVQVPYNFEARAYQKNLYNCLPSGKKRGVAVWHRRAGKDKVFMAILARESMKRVGSYFYLLPYYKQVRKILWDGMDGAGVPYLSVFPDEIIEHKNNQEMILTLKNGSKVYFLGSDNIDSIVGTNPVGILFSEFSLHKPAAWDFLRPILIENGGWALFNGTPRGKNHFYRMIQAAEDNPDEWFSEVLSISDTDVMTVKQIEDEINNGMPEAVAKQEFYCSFDAALTGAYYDKQMQTAHVEIFSADPHTPVDVSWDLGISDTMVLVLTQTTPGGTRFLDVIAANGQGLEYYVKKLQEKPYVYGTHYLPHDVKARELSNGQSRLSTLYSLGLKNIIVNKKASVEDGINATRKLLSGAWFHKINCRQLIEALKGYRAQYDEANQVYGSPVHDWCSHYADAVRQLAMGMREKVDASKLPDMAIGTGYDPIHPTVDSYPYQDRTAFLPFGGRYQNQETEWNPGSYDYATD